MSLFVPTSVSPSICIILGFNCADYSNTTNPRLHLQV